jgi:hypothetical protein
MPQFVAKPLHVQAWQILTVHRNHIRLDVPAGYDPDVFLTARQVNSRYPVAGDYYVMLDDGFAFVSPRHVFERKYAPAPGRHGTTRQDLRSPFEQSVATFRYGI